MDKFMTHLCLMSAAVIAGTVVDVVPGAVGAVGVVDVVVVVLALLESLVLCAFVILWGCPAKRESLLKVLKVLKL